MKKCSFCNTVKELTEFTKCKKEKYGVDYMCRSCRRIKYLKNRKLVIEKSKISYYKNIKARRINARNYYHNNREKVLEKVASYRMVNAETIAEKKKKKWDEKDLKYMARSITYLAIKRGDLIKKPCEICGEVDTEGHHEDYNKPLEVTWLCKEHHFNRHVEINNSLLYKIK